MEEIWKDISGYEGLYQISNLGNARTLNKSVITKNSTRRYTGKEIKKTKGNHGYYVVTLNHKGQLLHRLVAITFLENPENKDSVNHKDFNRLNNKVENLEWVTRTENVKHQYINGHIPMGEKHPYSQLNDFQVRVIKRTKGFYQRELGEIFGVSRNVIRFILTGRSWKHIS